LLVFAAALAAAADTVAPTFLLLFRRGGGGGKGPLGDAGQNLLYGEPGCGAMFGREGVDSAYNLGIQLGGRICTGILQPAGEPFCILLFVHRSSP
jgi:hypothetical protein